MDYTELFHSLHPGFFDRESIRALPLSDVSAEQVLYLDRFVPEKTCFPFPDGIRFDIMPAAIFTSPEAACVGPSEEQLQQQGVAYECKKSFWRANGKALAMGETEGMLKLFSSRGLILGCHAYGAHSADIVQEVSALMCKHTTIGELADMVHIHPTLSEILQA